MKNPQTLILDGGNFELKTFNGRDTSAIRSNYFQLPQGVNALQGSETSPLIELQEGTRYHFGYQANNYRNQQATVTVEKSELVKLHFYAVNPHRSGEVAVICAHHTPSAYRQTIERSLIGKHTYKKNGKDYNVTVTAVSVVPEGLGAYWFAKSQKLIPERGLTLLIDIGGGTWLSRLIDPTGQEIPDSDRIYDPEGTYALAMNIAADNRLRDALRPFRISPKPSPVQDGFSRGHLYEETGVSWAPWFDEYLKPWFNNILQTAKTDNNPQMARITRILIAGGGSYLVEDHIKSMETKSIVRLCPDPQFANVRGMHLHFVSSQAQQAA